MATDHSGQPVRDAPVPDVDDPALADPAFVEPESPPLPDEIPAEGTVDPSGVLLQLFHWYLPHDGSWWRTTAERAADIASAGFTAVWLPPAYKGHVGGYDVGYGVYDLYDL